MRNYRLILLATILFSTLFTSASFSKTQEIKEYRAVKGDTLWSISEKELNDPFLWPKVWKENPEIKNPDRIYPGQIIRIPLYLLKKETEKREKESAKTAPEQGREKEKVVTEKASPARLRYLVDRNTLIASGYIAPSIPRIGRITGSPSGRNIAGNNDFVYITTDKPSNIGDRFYIIRASGELVKHPVTGQKIGYLVDILGIAKVDRFEYGQTIAKIIRCFEDINTGDFLDTFYTIEPPVLEKSYRKPDIHGYVIENRSLSIMNIISDIVFIDKGKKDGIEVGDLFQTVAVEANKIPNGTIQIIQTRDNTATAIIRRSTGPVTVGNLFTHLD